MERTFLNVKESMKHIGEDVDIARLVDRLRCTVVIGCCVDLIPYQPRHAGIVVKLRNRPDVRYFLNQEMETTIESQHLWHEGYLNRRNDLFWVLQNKAGVIVGCNRLYNISDEQAEKGSQIVDLQHGRAAPIALEADLLAIKLAFNAVGARAVVARVRHDNQKVISMNLRIGFRTFGTELVNEIPYHVLRLERKKFQPAALDQVIDYWSKRNVRKDT